MNSRKLEQLIIFLIVLTFYGYFIRPADWNIASRLDLVRAMVEEKRLTIDSYHANTGDKAFVNGHYYSDKAIGISLLGALVYLPINGLISEPWDAQLFTMVITVLAIGVPSALLAPLLYDISLRIVKEKWMAVTITLCISLATPIFPYAGTFYGHSVTAMLAFSIFFLWMEVNQFNIPITRNRLLLSGFLLGYMVLTEYTTLIIAILLIAYMGHVVRTKQITSYWKIAAPFFAGAAIPLILFITYNWICFGSPLSIGYANENLQEFKQAHSEGLMGIRWPNLEVLLYMTIHPMLGLFIQSSVLLAAMGGSRIWREKNLRAELMVITSMILIYFLAISGLKIWWGGDAFTVRHLIPILPFFGIYMMFVPRKYFPFLIGLGILSFAQMLIASATMYHFFDQYIRETIQQGFIFSWETSLFHREMIPKLLHHRLTFTWGKYLFGIESWYFNFAIPIVIAIILLIVLYVSARQAEKNFDESLSNQHH